MPSRRHQLGGTAGRAAVAGARGLHRVATRPGGGKLPVRASGTRLGRRPPRSDVLDHAPAQPPGCPSDREEQQGACVPQRWARHRMDRCRPRLAGVTAMGGQASQDARDRRRRSLRPTAGGQPAGQLSARPYPDPEHQDRSGDDAEAEFGRPGALPSGSGRVGHDLSSRMAASVSTRSTSSGLTPCSTTNDR